MKRRGFLGFLGGAVAAGPSVAKTAVAELPKGIASSGYISNSLGACAPSSYPYEPSSGDWRVKEIANLRRLISGDLTEEEKEQERRSRLYRTRNTISQNVAGLHSVSGVHKLRMYDEQMGRLQKRIQRSESKGYLARLLKEMGK